MLVCNTQVIDHEGQQVYFEVSPASWMNRGYGLQVGISLTKNAVNAETEFVRDETYEASDKTMEQLNEAAMAIVVKWLAENGTEPLKASQESWRGKKAEFNAMMEEENKRASAAQKRADKRYKSKGYTHRVNAVIHPLHGDDHVVVSYVAGVPTEKDIAQILRSSAVKTDYVVTEL